MSIRDKFVLEKRFFIEGIEPAVPENGFRFLNDFLYPKYGRDVPVTFDNRWMVKDSKEELQGSFPKRLASLLHREFGIDITSGDKEYLGTKAKSYCFSRPRYEYEFTDNLSWESGAFGDSGSCYWGCHNFARAIMIYNDSLAIRFYEEDGGWGRAWIHFSSKYPDCLFISNAYPKGFALDQVALILARHFDLSYKPIKLVNFGAWDGMLYINNGRGIVLFPHEFTQDVFDLEFDPGKVRCSECNRLTNDDYTYISNHGLLFCYRCRDQLFFKCVKCLQMKDMSERAEERIEGYIVCKPCEKTVKSCMECGEKHFDITDVGLCTRCHEKKYVNCAYCGKQIERKTTFEYDGYRYCDRCHERYFIACSDCGEMTSKRESRQLYQSEKYICITCLTNYTRCRFCGSPHKSKEKCACRPKDKGKGVQEEILKLNFDEQGKIIFQPNYGYIPHWPIISTSVSTTDDNTAYFLGEVYNHAGSIGTPIPDEPDEYIPF